MPIYVYRCESCDKEVEHLLSRLEAEGADTLPCECLGQMTKQFTFHAGYKIKGDNSASTKPNRFKK